MLIFPILYLASFVLSLKELIKGNKQGLFLFLIFGLPIYVSTLTVLFSSGFKDIMAPVQLFKEFIILFALALNVWALKKE